MNKRKQSGFTVWGILLLLIILAIAILVSWYIWKANKQDDTPQQNTSNDSAQIEGPAQDWLHFAAPNEWYSMRIPDGWNLTVNTSSSILYCVEASDCITHTPGQTASVDQTTEGVESDFAFFLKPVGANTGETEELLFQSYEPSGTIEAVNVTGNAYKKTFTENEPHGPGAGDTQYGYAFSKGDRNIFVTYTVKQNQSGDLTTVEDMLATLQVQ